LLQVFNIGAEAGIVAMTNWTTRATRCALLLAFTLCSAAAPNESGIWAAPRTASATPQGAGAAPDAREIKVLLLTFGEMLFLDRRLSSDGKKSCSTCHRPDTAFTDGLQVARGANGAIGTRNTPAFRNAVFSTLQSWDGRSTTLEEQILSAFSSEHEHGFADLRQSDTAFG